MAAQNQTKIRLIAKDARYFIFGILILYLIGCFILSLTLWFFKEWGLVDRGANGVYFTLDDSSIELIDFYNVFNTPRLTYLHLFRGHPVFTCLLSLLLFLALIRITSYFKKGKEAIALVDKKEKQECAKLKPAFFDFVILNLVGSTKEEVFFAISKFAKGKGLVKNQQYLYERLLEKERMGSTAIGGGIALPEACFIEMSQHHALILCRAKAGVDFDSFDGKPVYIMPVFLCTEKNDLSWLEPILQLVNLLKSDKYKDRFMEVSTEYEMYQLLEKVSLQKDLGQPA
jgi:PTS system nitrogen regulatory IIA component